MVYVDAEELQNLRDELQRLRAEKENFVSRRLYDFSKRQTRKYRILYRKIKGLALQDSLTKMPNHRAFQNEYVAICKDLQRSANQQEKPVSFCVMIVDATKLKWINDHISRETGDQLLIHIAQCLKQGVRPRDGIYRLGDRSDEFVVVLSDTSIDEAWKVWQRVYDLIRRTGSIFSATAGIACSQLSPQPLKQLNANALKVMRDSTFDAADRNLQEEKKRSGTGRQD